VLCAEILVIVLLLLNTILLCLNDSVLIVCDYMLIIVCLCVAVTDGGRVSSDGTRT